MRKTAPAKQLVRGSGAYVVKRSAVSNVRSRRFKRVLAVRRGCRGTVYDGPFDLEKEEELRLYVRWFRINYPAPRGLVSISETFFGFELLS